MVTISLDQIQGKITPFKIFREKDDLNVIHAFINYILAQGFDPKLNCPTTRKIKIANFFKEFDLSTYRKLRRIIRKYEISFNDFIVIISDAIELISNEETLLISN